jgi:hypothetical protein
VPARSGVLPEKLTGSPLVKKFLTFYGNRIFITAFTRDRHLSLSCARLVQSKPISHFRKIHFKSILPSTPGSSRWPLPLDPSSKTLYAPLPFPIRSTCPAHPILLDLLNRIVFGKYRSLCSSFKKKCSSSAFICPVFYNILLSNYRCVQFKTRHLAALSVTYS